MFVEKARLVPKEAVFGNNTTQAILAIAGRMAEGEILVRENKLEAGIAELGEAIKLEDALNYDEPSGWMVPVRHSLGAALMKHGRYAEAEHVYRDDLARIPANGWSLFGLTNSLRAQKKNAGEADALDANFKRLWAKADTKITSSCLCQPMKKRN
jgi:tetratricopeptide (TPR) repeat protein